MTITNVYRRTFIILTLLFPACKPAAPPDTPAPPPPAKTDPTAAEAPTKTNAPSDKQSAKPDTPAVAPTPKPDALVEKPSAKTDERVESPSAKSNARIDTQPLLDVLCELPVWRASRDFTAQEWDQLIAAARRIQTSNPADVRAALDKSPHCGPTMNLDVIPLEFLPTSKEFILLRIAFDVPETVPPEYPNKFWLRSADALWTVSWPVRWRNGRPEQLARFAGFEGFAYIPAGEWDHFKAEFPFRKLPPP